MVHSESRCTAGEEAPVHSSRSSDAGSSCPTSSLYIHSGTEQASSNATVYHLAAAGWY